MLDEFGFECRKIAPRLRSSALVQIQDHDVVVVLARSQVDADEGGLAILRPAPSRFRLPAGRATGAPNVWNVRRLTVTDSRKQRPVLRPRPTGVSAMP